MSVITMVVFAVFFIVRGWLCICRPAWSTMYKAWELKHGRSQTGAEHTILRTKRMGWLYLIAGSGILASVIILVVC